jgi:hypothetical protein
MMIGLTCFTEGWGKILDLDKFILLCSHIFDRITNSLHLFGSNFKNIVNNEVEPHAK